MMGMSSKIVPRVRTVSDLRKVLRNKSKTCRFPLYSDYEAWDKILKQVGRTAGDDLTLRTLRHLEIQVADHLNLTLCDLAPKTLVEFAEACKTSPGLPQSKRERAQRRRGRPRDTDPKRDRELSESWRMSSCRTYEEGARMLQARFSDLTRDKLRRAVDRYRHRQPSRLWK